MYVQMVNLLMANLANKSVLEVNWNMMDFATANKVAIGMGINVNTVEMGKCIMV